MLCSHDKIAKLIPPGTRFHRLVVLPEFRRTNIGRRWLCRCDCGRYKYILASQLRNGDSKTCGCARGNTARTEAVRVAREVSPALDAKFAHVLRCAGVVVKDAPSVDPSIDLSLESQ